MCKSAWSVGLVCVLSARLLSSAEPTAPMRVDRNATSGQLTIYEADRPVLQYNYQTVQPPRGYVQNIRSGNRKYALARSNYIHPLYGPEGRPLTLDWSKDHPHHRGIYWAWPEVQYEGQTKDLHALQGVLARPTGKIQLKNGSGGDFAEIQAENHWVWADKTPIVRELASIRAWKSMPHGRFIDLTFRFTALVDGVTLARRQTSKYGGLNVRLAPIKDMKLLHHADPPGVKPRQAWQAATGTWVSATRPVALVVYEKATNPQYPGDYIEFPQLPWFQPTFPRAKTRYPLKKAVPLILRYRLWIKSGAPPTEAQFRAEWQAYQSNKPQEAEP